MKFLRVFMAALVVALAMTTAVAISPGGAATPSAAQGVTKDEIVVSVLVADVDALRAKGITLSPQLTNENQIRRAQFLADAYGPINGRKLVFKPAVWDPLDATTFDKACTQATVDNKPFLVINGSGYRADSVACIAIDNKTPFFLGESSYGDLQKAAGNMLVAAALPAEVNGATTAALAPKAGLITKSSKIGMIASNEPLRKAAADELQNKLKKQGYNIIKRVDINSLTADAASINTESTAAVETLKEAGVDTVFVAASNTNTRGYFQEYTRANPGFKNILVDIAGNQCTTFAATNLPASAAGIPCITTYDTKAVSTKDGVKADNAFEAKCRSQYAKATGWTPQPGAQSGGTNVNGQHWDEDIPYNECNMMNVLLPAIKAAGKDLTWSKVYDNMMKATSAPMAYLSNGKGGFSKTKPYLATQVHLETLNPVTPTTPLDANGKTYGGCPLPINCFVPQLINGQEWFPASKP